MDSNQYALIPIADSIEATKHYNKKIDISEELQQTGSQSQEESHKKQYALVPAFRRLTVTEDYTSTPNKPEQSQVVEGHPIAKTTSYALALNDEAVELSHQLDFEQAIALFNEAIALDSSSTDIMCNRGMAYRSWGKLELAIKDFDEALKLKPDHVEARFRRGFCYFELQNFHQAKEDFTATIEKDPNHVWAFYLRGRIYMAVEGFDRAKSDFQEAKKLALQQKDTAVVNLASKMLAAVEEKNSKKQKRGKSFFKKSEERVVTIKESSYLQERTFYLEKIAELEQRVKDLEKELKKK